MSAPRHRRLQPWIAYLLSLPLVAITAWAMLGLLRMINALEPSAHVHPYISGFYLTVALVTWIGGRKPGLFCLALSILTSVLFLMEPRFSLLVNHPSDIATLIILALVSGFLVLGVDALRTNVMLLRDTQEAQTRLRAIMDTAPVGILLSDLDGTLRYANKEAERIWGHPLISVGRDEWQQYRLLKPDGTVSAPEETSLGRVLSGQEKTASREMVVERPDGSRVWVDNTATLVNGPRGNPISGLVVFSDVSERKQAEEALRESETRKSAILESAMDCIITMDGEGRIIEWNPAAERTFGYSRGQALGTFVSDLIIPASFREQHWIGLSRYLATGEGPVLGKRIELPALRADGTEFPVELAITPINIDSRPIFTAYLRDITARKEADAEIQRLLATEQARADREELINRIGQTLRSTLDPALIQLRAVMALGSALGADRCFFVLFDYAKEFAHVSDDWYGDALASISGDYHLTDYAVDFVSFFRSGTSQVVEDTHTHKSFQADVPALAQLGLRSGICVPLYDRGRLVAALVVAMAEGTRLWTAEEVSLTEAVAAQTRAAVEAARVRQREHTIATTLQEALRPSPPEKVPGLDLAFYYKPALDEASIGGDFYDVFSLDKGCLVLVVGDLSGKGLAAAAQVATVRNMLRYALYHNGRTAEAVAELNTILVAHNLLKGFATLFVGIYDTGTHSLTYVSCGQEPGLVHRAASNRIEELPPTGPVLGMAEEAIFEQRQVVMSPGDAFILYTDGFTEAGRRRRDLLGVAGMAALLADPAVRGSAHALMTHLVAGTEAHAAGDLQDDACLLAALVQPASP